MSSMWRPMTRTNDAFFVQQIQNINVTATDEQLVDFLYKLGSDVSMIRVLDLELQPDPPHQKLNANIRLVASYQRNAPASLENRNRNRQMKTTRLRSLLRLAATRPVASARRAMKPLTPCQMKTTPLVLILFLTVPGLWAQTPATTLTPAQMRRLQQEGAAPRHDQQRGGGVRGVAGESRSRRATGGRARVRWSGDGFGHGNDDTGSGGFIRQRRRAGRGRCRLQV